MTLLYNAMTALYSKVFVISVAIGYKLYGRLEDDLWQGGLLC